MAHDGETGSCMHVHVVGEPDDGASVSSHHARALSLAGFRTTFDQSAPHESRAADVVHLMTESQADGALLRRLAMLRLRGTPIVRVWSGRDVLWAKHEPRSRQFALAVARLGAVQVARTQGLADELSRLSITAVHGGALSVHIADTCKPEPLPATFTVLCHLPTLRRDFCGGKLIDALMDRLANVRFLVLGDEATDYRTRSNVESLGFVEDVSRAIKRSTVVVQPRMDGVLSRLSLESLCHGRHVIASHGMPHVQYAASVDAFALGIRALEREADFNLAGREYVCREFGCAAMTQRLVEILQQAIDPRSSAATRVGRWRSVLVALGGTSLAGDGSLSDTRPSTDDAEAFAALCGPAARHSPAEARGAAAG
jgi:hypothetical protein